MPTIRDFHGTTSRDEAVHVVYLEQRDARAAFAFVIVGDALPRIVHWGRPLSDPSTLVACVDALRPQRVSGALDETVRGMDGRAAFRRARRRRRTVLPIRRH